MKLSKNTKAIVMLVNLFVWLSGISASQAAELDPRMGTTTIIPSLTKPTISSVVLIGSTGSTSTTPTLSVSIKVKYTGGAPTAYRVSETSSGLSRTSWKSYSSFPLPKYTFRNTSQGTKRLYVQLMNKAGISAAGNDTIKYQPPLSIVSVTAQSNPVALNLNSLTVKFAGVAPNGKVKLTRFGKPSYYIGNECYFKHQGNTNPVEATADSNGNASITILGWFDAPHWAGGKYPRNATNSTYNCKLHLEAQRASAGSNSFSGVVQLASSPVQVQGLVKHIIENTSTMSQITFSLRQAHVGTCEGTVMYGDLQPIGVGFTKGNYGKSITIFGGPIGTRCTYIAYSSILPVGFFWGNLTFENYAKGDKCKVEVTSTDSGGPYPATPLGLYTSTMNACRSDEVRVHPRLDTGSDRYIADPTFDYRGPRSSTKRLCAAMHCKPASTVTFDNAGLLFKSAVVYGPPGKSFP